MRFTGTGASSCLCLFLLLSAADLTRGDSAIRLGPDGRLTYAEDEFGNHVPDFSACGYHRNELQIPQVPPRIYLQSGGADDTLRIQAAIDYVSHLKPNGQGFRGAVRLAPGEFRLAGQLLIRESGVVLQGSGATADGTTLLATGTDRRPVVRILGDGEPTVAASKTLRIEDDYVPVGAVSITLGAIADLEVGDTVLITRPSIQAWIKLLGAKFQGIGWRPGSRDLVWERQITAIDGNRTSLDSPITNSLTKQYGGGTVQQYVWLGRLREVGVEDLRIISQVESENPKDEDHPWFGIVIDKATDCWVRRIVFSQFAGGTVSLGRFTTRITVEDCLSRNPISELGGYRRHTYFTLGQLGLFHRCWSELGMHDFSTGHCSAGPNVFLYCRASRAYAESGPLESWSAGVLYDNVRIDGSNLCFENRWSTPAGAGWSAANCVSWQCRAANLRCFRPPGANNWAIGAWATPAGDGVIESLSDFVRPFSLFEAQVQDRLGAEVARHFHAKFGRPLASTSPTYAEAEQFVARSSGPAETLKSWIELNLEESSKHLRQESAELVQQDQLDAVRLQPLAKDANDTQPELAIDFQPLVVSNGWLTREGQLISGKRYDPGWWRGSIRGAEPLAFSHNLTRFAPGRFGTGVTEDVEDIVEDLVAKGFASYSHHYGLWYDRRRDDHLMVRRADGEVVPPFYEQPFARSGLGTAWDGLSKYDLTRFNPWYWNRLREFAELGGSQGLVLLHQNYFQHNIIEAGAHWADCPWRPANNLQELELPEPPPYIGDKRLFMAHHFYNVDSPHLRETHRRYIHQCLEAFRGIPNVLQMTSAEYTGPLEFTQFWLDTIVEWEKRNQQDVLLTLSCTKDVQDEILVDPKRGLSVDVIDVSYWTYDKNTQLYAPLGGKSMAPRQHMRQLNPKPSSFASILRAVKEYRQKYPKKAVIYNADRFCVSPNEGWAVLMGGGSLPNISLPEELRAVIPSMVPSDDFRESDTCWKLKSKNHLLLYCKDSHDRLSLPNVEDKRISVIHWLNPDSGEILESETLPAGDNSNIKQKSRVAWIEFAAS